MVNLVTLGIMARAIPIDGIENLTKLRTLLLRGDGNRKKRVFLTNIRLEFGPTHTGSKPSQGRRRN